MNNLKKRPETELHKNMLIVSDLWEEAGVFILKSALFI